MGWRDIKLDLNFSIDTDQVNGQSVTYFPVETVRKAHAPTRGFGRTGREPVSTYYDGFKRRFLPGNTTLIQEYKRTVYTCANLNAQACISTPLRLFFRKEQQKSQSLLRNGRETKSISSEEKDRLSSLPHLQKTLRSFVDIEEVVFHPALTILETANDTQFLNGFKLQELLYLYMDIIGQAYWLIENNIFEVPFKLWILPSQNVFPIKKDGSTNIVDFYEYRDGTDKPPIKYSIEDIIPFTLADLRNPYTEGMSFVEAAYEANKAHNQLLTLETALLENEGRPELVIIPDDDSGIGPDEAERFEDEWRARFGRGRQGGIYVLPEKVKIEPIQVPLRDLARMEISKWTKNDIANAASVPFALISDASHNRQQLEAAEIQHSKHAVIPRQRRVTCVLNDQLLSRYDPTGRLFFAYDDPIPEDREVKLQENVQLVMNRIKTPNEARQEYNLPPISGGDELQSINDPSRLRQEERDSGSAEN